MGGSPPQFQFFFSHMQVFRIGNQRRQKLFVEGSKRSKARPEYERVAFPEALPAVPVVVELPARVVLTPKAAPMTVVPMTVPPPLEFSQDLSLLLKKWGRPEFPSDGPSGEPAATDSFTIESVATVEGKMAEENVDVTKKNVDVANKNVDSKKEEIHSIARRRKNNERRKFIWRNHLNHLRRGKKKEAKTPPVKTERKDESKRLNAKKVEKKAEQKAEEKADEKAESKKQVEKKAESGRKERKAGTGRQGSRQGGSVMIIGAKRKPNPCSNALYSRKTSRLTGLWKWIRSLLAPKPH